MIFRIKKIAAGILLVFALGQNDSFAQKKSVQLFEVTASKSLLGTIVDMKALHESVQPARLAFYEAFKEIERIEGLLSSHNPDSEISKVNQQAGNKPVKVSYETFAILQRANNYSEQFNGMFDVTIGPLTLLWGFNGDKEVSIPEEEKLAAMLQFVDYKKISLSRKDTTAALTKAGMQIDLGGIAKGYAIDRAAMILKQNNVTRFLINAGGDIYASGLKADSSKWVVGIQHPRQPNELLAKCELSDFAVATSGDYERYSEIDGKRYHHILNPETGYPADLCQSVTVLTSTAEKADVWATYLFLIGYHGYQKKYAGAFVQSIFVDQKGKRYYDKALEKKIGLEFLN